MILLVAIIFVSLAFYVFYKIKAFRTRLPMEKKWLKGKSTIALGVFCHLRNQSAHSVSHDYDLYYWRNLYRYWRIKHLGRI